MHERMRHSLEELAYEAWLRRGRPMGSPDVDWADACKAYVADQADQEIPLSAPGSMPTDLGSEPIPEQSHDTSSNRS